MTKRSGTYTTPDGRSGTWEQQGLPLDLERIHADEWLRAARVGIERVHGCRLIGAQRRDATRNQAKDDIDGAVAECIVSHTLVGSWEPATWDKRKHGDLRLPVVGAVEVKSTEHPTGGLAVQADDEDRPFVLVVGVVQWYGEWAALRVPGWAYAREAQQERFYRRDWTDAAYCLPQSLLRPLSSLRDWIEGKG